MPSDSHGADLPDVQEISERIARITERSQKVWLNSLERSVSSNASTQPDPLNTFPVMARLAQQWLEHPEKLGEATLAYWTQQAELWTRMMKRSMGAEDTEPLVTPPKGDKRFQDPMWRENPFFDYLKQSYLVTGSWLKERLAEADSLPDADRKKLEFLTRNFIEALAPSNYAGTNPEVLKATVEQKGENLLRGLENLVRDLERGKGQLLIRQTDMDAFKVGENLATAPGKVVYQNEIMQLIQYAPTTEKVYERPLLIVPPWINKYYILDINEKKSMLRWLVGQGHTVFIISWVNPDERQAGETWESYMRKGVLTAIDKVIAETEVAKIDITGYCIGGTMLGTTLAYMAATGDDRVGSATFLTTQLEFTDAGDLQTFVDQGVLDILKEKVEEQGYLDAENMLAAFNSLRSTDLIWGFVVNNYLLGKDNFPFDLLYWNSDSTRMPGKLHLYYLEQFYFRNTLARGELEIDGIPLDLKKVKQPAYHVATREDHIAPSPSAYRAAKLLGGRSQRFVLAGSGHIAGVINPPAAEKYQHWVKDGVREPNLEEWLKGTEEQPGSWWPDWQAWLAKRSRRKVPAREPGQVLGTIEDAPGSYVQVRFDEG